MGLLNKVNDWSIDLYTDVQASMKANPGSARKSFGVGAAIGMLVFGGSVAYAAPDTAEIDAFGDDIYTIIAKIYDKSFAVITVLAALLAVFAFVVRMSGNQQRSAQATQWLIRIAVAYVGINAIGLIMKLIQNTTSSYKFDPNATAGQ